MSASIGDWGASFLHLVALANRGLEIRMHRRNGVWKLRVYRIDGRYFLRTNVRAEAADLRVAILNLSRHAGLETLGIR